MTHTKTKPKLQPKANFVIDMHIYPFDLMVSVNQTDKELTTALKRKGVTEHVPALIAYGAVNNPAKYAFWNKDSMFLIRMKELPTTPMQFGMLAHEVSHVVTWALEELGFKLKASSSGEAYAYLTGFLTEKIYSGLNKHY